MSSRGEGTQMPMDISSGPSLEIEQHVFWERFRYATEQRAAKKHRNDSFMKVKLANIPPGSCMKIFCVQSDPASVKPHPNTLDGPNCKDGLYFMDNLPNHGNINIPWLQINRTKKDDKLIVLQKLSQYTQEFPNACQQVLEDLNNRVKIDTKQVRLCVLVSGVYLGHPYSIHKLTEDITTDEKGTQLEILELSRSSASVNTVGITNHIFLTEASPCIEKAMVSVRMEQLDAGGNVTWASKEFHPGKNDILYKHVIRYPVPQYRHQDITEPVQVDLVLKCRRSGQENRKPFLYQPEPDCIQEKRKRKHVDFSRYTDNGISQNKACRMDNSIIRQQIRDKVSATGMMNATSNQAMMTATTSYQAMMNAAPSNQAMMTAATPNQPMMTAETSNQAMMNVATSNQAMMNVATSNQSMLNATSFNQPMMTATTSNQAMMNVAPSNQAMMNATSFKQAMLNAASFNQSMLSAASPNHAMMTASTFNQSMMNAASSNQAMMNVAPSNQEMMTAEPSNQAMMTAEPSNQTMMNATTSNQAMMTAATSNQEMMTAATSNQTAMTALTSNQTTMTATTSKQVMMTATTFNRPTPKQAMVNAATYNQTIIKDHGFFSDADQMHDNGNDSSSIDDQANESDLLLEVMKESGIAAKQPVKSHDLIRVPLQKDLTFSRSFIHMPSGEQLSGDTSGSMKEVHEKHTDKGERPGQGCCKGKLEMMEKFRQLSTDSVSDTDLSSVADVVTIDDDDDHHLQMMTSPITHCEAGLISQDHELQDHSASSQGQGQNEGQSMNPGQVQGDIASVQVGSDYPQQSLGLTSLPSCAFNDILNLNSADLKQLIEIDSQLVME